VTKSVRWLLVLLVLLVCWGASWWLVADAFSYSLSPEDPETGRMRGCYTALEEWLGVQQPLAWLRPAEQILGTALFLGIPLVSSAWGVRLFLSRRRAPNITSDHGGSSQKR
jgi:hypothetical protein